MTDTPEFSVDLVEPRSVPDLTVWADAHDLVLANGSGEQRYGLRNIALRARDGDILRFAADGAEFALRSLSAHPLDLVEYVLDARAAARGNTVAAVRERRPWPELPLGDEATAVTDAVMRGPEVGPQSQAGRRRRRSRRRILLAGVVAIAVAVVGGSFIGDVVNELSGPGVGNSTDIGGTLVVRDVQGIGDEVLSPFTAAGPWELTWEKTLSAEESELTVAAISNVNHAEQVIVDGEVLQSGTVGPFESGGYRLSIESDGSWRVVVTITR